MQSLRSRIVPALLATWMLSASGPNAQEPSAEQPSARPERSESGSESPQAPSQEPRRSRRRGGARRRGLIVLEAGMVHPVSGPPIENGVVVIRGERILAVGRQGELQLPPNTEVLQFPEGHIYPGLIDASTDAFTDAGLQKDGSLNGGSALSEALMWTGDRDDMLAEHGITTAYINVRSPAQVRGQGAVVRPQREGFELWTDREQAALQLLMAVGAGAQHPLQRQAKLTATGKIFDGLEGYRDALEKFDKDLKKYNEEFEKYLDHHRKKTGKGDKAPEKGEAKPAEGDKPASEPEPAEGRRRGRGPGGRRRPGGGGRDGGGERAPDLDTDQAAIEQTLATVLALLANQPEDVPNRAMDPQRSPKLGARVKQDPAPQGKAPQDKAPQGKAPQGKESGEDKKKSDGPKRPKYPKKPRNDPQKDALAKVIDGAIPLRIEAHRVEELRAALRLQRDNDVPQIVLEQAYAAGLVADEIAEQGATVVLTNVMPNALGDAGDKRNPFAKFDLTKLPKQLEDAGVPFAIASGSARLASVLPMMGAAAVGGGISTEAALRAMTLTPAEILGVAEDTGSLTREKYADVLVTDGPLFASDTRVMLVLSKGRKEFERR